MRFVTTSTAKMEVVGYFETSVSTCKAVRSQVKARVHGVTRGQDYKESNPGDVEWSCRPEKAA
jgi:hypothetical protein